MNKKNIEYYLGILLIIGLIFYSFTTNININIFPEEDSLNTKLSASVEEIEINSEEEIDSNSDSNSNSKINIYSSNEYGYQFKYPKDLEVEKLPGVIKLKSSSKEIKHYVLRNPARLTTREWVSKDMAESIAKRNEKIKIGDKIFNKEELEIFFQNILDKSSEEQFEALSYLQYNSMRYLYLENEGREEGKQVVQLTSRKNGINDSFYVSFNNYILVFEYSTRDLQEKNQYRNYIREIIKAIERI